MFVSVFNPNTDSVRFSIAVNLAVCGSAAERRSIFIDSSARADGERRSARIGSEGRRRKGLG